MEKLKNNFKSVRFRLFLIMCIVIAVIVICLIIVNSVVLESFYIYSKTKTVRNVYIIDDKGIIRLILVYPLNVGRCIPEILRALQALQVADSNKAATPANWVPCEPIIEPIPQTFDGLLTRANEINQNRNGMNWYLSFKQPENCIKLNQNENKELGC